MVTIESYSYDLPGQSGYFARDEAGTPIAARKSFPDLLKALETLGHAVFAWSGEGFYRSVREPEHRVYFSAK